MPAGRAQRPLRLVSNNIGSRAETTWFCGRCAAPAGDGAAPSPSMRVCPSCGLGLMLESRVDLAPSPADAFMIIDSRLAIEAMSERSEQLLEITELEAIHRPMDELIVPAYVDGTNDDAVVRAVIDAATDSNELVSCFVRPRNTFGVRLRVRVGACGPPRAALMVFEVERPQLRCV